MKKSEIIDYPTLKKYCRQQVQVFNRLRAEFKAKYVQVLHNNRLDFLKEDFQGVQQELDYFMSQLNLSKDALSTKSALREALEEIDGYVTGARGLCDEMNEYFKLNGAKDQKIIAEIVSQVDSRYKKFNEEWRPFVAQALRDKKYAAVAEFIESFERYPIDIKYYDGESARRFENYFALGMKNQKINEWVNITKKALPRKVLLEARIKRLTTLFRSHYNLMSCVCGQLSQVTDDRARGKVPLITNSNETRQINDLAQELAKCNARRHELESALQGATEELNELIKNPAQNKLAHG